MLSLFEQLGVYTKASLLDITHHIHKSESFVEYACLTIHISRRLTGEKVEKSPNTYKEVMTQPTKMQWKSVSDKGVDSRKNSNVFTLLLANFVFSGHEVIGSQG